jgi:hypothetical protein
MSRRRSLKEHRELAEIDKIRAESTALRLNSLKEIMTLVTVLFTGYAGATAIRPVDPKSLQPPQSVAVVSVERRNAVTDPPLPDDMTASLSLPKYVSPETAKVLLKLVVDRQKDPVKARSSAIKELTRLRNQSQEKFGSDSQEARNLDFLIHFVEQQMY